MRALAGTRGRGGAGAAARRATEAPSSTALDRDLDPMGNLQGRPDTKRHLAKVLTRRVLAEIAARDGAPA